MTNPLLVAIIGLLLTLIFVVGTGITKVLEKMDTLKTVLKEKSNAKQRERR